MKRSSHFLYRFLWDVLSHRDLLRPGDHCPLQATNHSTDSTASLFGRKIQYRSLQLYRHDIWFLRFPKVFCYDFEGLSWFNMVSTLSDLSDPRYGTAAAPSTPLGCRYAIPSRLPKQEPKDAWARLPRNMKRANDDNRWCVPSSLPGCIINRPRRHPMTPTIQTLVASARPTTGAQTPTR